MTNNTKVVSEVLNCRVLTGQTLHQTPSRGFSFHCCWFLPLRHVGSTSRPNQEPLNKRAHTNKQTHLLSFIASSYLSAACIGLRILTHSRLQRFSNSTKVCKSAIQTLCFSPRCSPRDTLLCLQCLRYSKALLLFDEKERGESWLLSEARRTETFHWNDATY